MIWMIRRIWRDFPTYEASVRYALVVGLGLLVIMALALLFGVPEIRIYAAIGAGLTVIVMEAAVLWGNRRMVTPYTQAQRAYLAGDFEQARRVLESEREAGRADMRALTLLGNTYRQIGWLSKSREVLYEAVDKDGDHHFPLYGLGRTLLTEGRYSEAFDVLARAVQAGAPSVVQLDVVESLYRAGRSDEAARLLRTLNDDQTLSSGAEPHRLLMAALLRHRLLDAPAPARDLIEAGLPFWEASAARFADSPYSQSLTQDLALFSSVMSGHSDR